MGKLTYNGKDVSFGYRENEQYQLIKDMKKRGISLDILCIVKDTKLNIIESLKLNIKDITIE